MVVSVCFFFLCFLSNIHSTENIRADIENKFISSFALRVGKHRRDIKSFLFINILKKAERISVHF